MNGQIIYVLNRLHVKAAELCLANSGNNRVITTKYMSTLIASTARVHALLFLSRGVGKVYCDVITRSRLQLINTLIDTFFSKLRAFLTGQKRRKASDIYKEARWHSGRIFSGSKNS